MATIDKLVKFLNSKNIAEGLDDETCNEIVENAIVGYEIDEDSRQSWLEINRQAMSMVKVMDDKGDKEFPFHKASKINYPLIPQAINQLAARLITQTVRNDRVGECKVLGIDDQPETDPKTGQPSTTMIKAGKAARTSEFLNFFHLVESKTWLIEDHKACNILSGWGHIFKELYYDHFTKRPCSIVLQPEDVIVNHRISSLDKAPRITIRQYMSKSDIMRRVKMGYFCDLDICDLEDTEMDNKSKENDSNEPSPSFEIMKQFCYLDLDEDDIDEPYFVCFHKATKTLLGIHPAFEFKDIVANPEKPGQVLNVIPRHNIVDCPLIDDPEGGFYGIGLNQLLFHLSKGITHTLRALLDAATASNTAGTSGFVTKAFKTKERNLKVKLGEFKVLETPPGVDIRQHIMNLPFKEPSQVLMALLQFLVETGEKTGFISDILTGDAQTQNVPATTSLAMLEQATRAFKPLVQKQQQFKKNEFQIWFHLQAKHFDQSNYIKFQGSYGDLSKNDFDENVMDIIPVADPSMSSEAHKYARLQAMIQWMQTPGVNAMNVEEATIRFYTDLQFPNPEKMIKPPQPAPPDPKMEQVKLNAQIADQQHQIQQLKAQEAAMKLQLQDKKIDSDHSIKQQEVNIKAHDSKVATHEVVVNAHKENIETHIAQRQQETEEYNADTERRRVEVLAQQKRHTDDSPGTK